LQGNDANLQEAFAAGLKGDWDLAIAKFDTVVQLNPRSATGWWGAAWARCRRHATSDIDKAIDDCTIANQIDPNDSAAYCVRGAASLLKFIETGEGCSAAVAPLTEAIRLEPDNPHYYHLRAAAYYRWILAALHGRATIGHEEPSKMNEDESAALRLEGHAGDKQELDRNLSRLVFIENVVPYVLDEMNKGLFYGYPIAQSKAAASPVHERPPPAIDRDMAKAYITHQRFLAPRILGTTLSNGPLRVRFSPLNQTRIARNGNEFRIRGWYAMSLEAEDPKTKNSHQHLGEVLWWDTSLEQDDKAAAAILPADLRVKGLHVHAYLCTLRLDPQLDIWHLGNVELIEQ
jgi:hypothetical protein